MSGRDRTGKTQSPSGTGMGCKYTPPSVSGAGTEREMGSRERGWGKQNSTPTHPVVMPIYFLMQMWDFQLWIYCNLLTQARAVRHFLHWMIGTCNGRKFSQLGDFKQNNFFLGIF